MTRRADEFADSLERVTKRLGGVETKLLAAEETLTRLEQRDQLRERRSKAQEEELRQKYDAIGR